MKCFPPELHLLKYPSRLIRVYYKIAVLLYSLVFIRKKKRSAKKEESQLSLEWLIISITINLRPQGWKQNALVSNKSKTALKLPTRAVLRLPKYIEREFCHSSSRIAVAGLQLEPSDPHCKLPSEPVSDRHCPTDCKMKEKILRWLPSLV